MLLPCVTERCPGPCCDLHEVPLTEADVSRLETATGRPAGTFTDEANDWILLRGAGADAEGCVFFGRLDVAGEAFRGCTVHEARPAACRTYPFVLERPAPDGAPPRIKRDPGCPHAAAFSEPRGMPERLQALWSQLEAEREARRRG